MPTTNGHPNGPFAYASTNRDSSGAARGYSAGGGLFSGPVGTDGGHLDLLAAQSHFGGWRGENGDTNVGAYAEASGAKVTIPTPSLGPAGHIDFEYLTANGGGYTNSDTSYLGTGASVSAIAATFGSEEEQTRFGLVAGHGGGARTHYGDADRDGVRELGFGFDAGPFSFDIRSESLGSAAKWLGLDPNGGSSGTW